LTRAPQMFMLRPYLVFQTTASSQFLILQY
jgi:hypothetical protein